MQAGQLLRYSERETIINEELKPMIPKYKRHEQLTELCNELEKLRFQNKLNEEKLEALKKLHKEKYELAQELNIYLDGFIKVRDLIFEEAIGSAQVSFKISTLLNRYNKFFQKRRKEYLNKLLRKTSEVRFTFEYPLRVPVFENKVINGQQQDHN